MTYQDGSIILFACAVKGSPEPIRQSYVTPKENIPYSPKHNFY